MDDAYTEWSIDDMVVVLVDDSVMDDADNSMSELEIVCVP